MPPIAGIKLDIKSHSIYRIYFRINFKSMNKNTIGRVLNMLTVFSAEEYETHQLKDILGMTFSGEDSVLVIW